MKFLFVLLLMMGLSVHADDILSRRGEFSPPPSIYDVEELNRVLFSELRTQNNELKKVKYYLLNGEIRMARVYLSKLAYTRTKLRPVIYRYLAMLSFIEGDFSKSYFYTAKPELQDIPYFSKICTLKVLNQIVLSKTFELEKDWPKCQLQNYKNINPSSIIWLDTLVQLKLNPNRGITRIPFKGIKLQAMDNDTLKIFLKLAMYLNQESLVIDQIPELTLDQLQDPEVREIAGQIFFRTGALAKSYRFIEDLKSPNSENIKGNLYILRKKYELAYAQFKLSLEQKQNSQNAMERILPLAWLLGDWEGGARYSEQVINSPQTQINKMTLTSAFHTQKGDYERASRILEHIAQKSRRGTSIEVTQLGSFNALMLNRPEMVKKQAIMSCDQYDLVNCWVLFQLAQWDAFPLTIRREEKITDKREWEKLISEEINAPLTETVFVNQIDIEEMDDKLVQLIPTP